MCFTFFGEKNKDAAIFCKDEKQGWQQFWVSFFVVAFCLISLCLIQVYTKHKHKSLLEHFFLFLILLLPHTKPSLLSKYSSDYYLYFSLLLIFRLYCSLINQLVKQVAGKVDIKVALGLLHLYCCEPTVKSPPDCHLYWR